MTGDDQRGRGLLGRFASNPGPWFALVWMPVLLLAPVGSAVAGADLVRVAALAAVAGLYVVAVVLPWRVRSWPASEAAVAALTLATIGYLFAYRDDGAFLFPLLSIAMAVAIRPAAALSFVSSLTISGVVSTWMGTGFDDALLLGFATFMAGVSALLITHLGRTLAELSATRQALTIAAVAEERQRFSRDLHDLLGHSLSVIVVKAEAVRRLAVRDPDAAAEHARGIEDVGRGALAEVRQAVLGYRAISLRSELRNARDALGAVGVVLRAAEIPALPAHVDAAFAWVVREAVTNVVRHARASTCSIGIVIDGWEASIEITDDGTGTDYDASGSGIAGLRERIGALGGVLVAGSAARGFRIGATVPLKGGPW